MNQRANESLDKLPETLTNAKSMPDVVNAVVATERLILKSNYEDRQSGVPVNYERREFEVGGPNTRGLSWKLVLFRTIAEATFCRMVRTGVHGGGINVYGQPENIDATIEIFNALVPVYDSLSKSAHDELANGAKPEGAEANGKATINKAGWTNQWLIQAPEELGTALKDSRAEDASKNGKLATMIADAETGLADYVKSLAPVKLDKSPKSPRAKKAAPAAASSDPNAPAPEDEEDLEGEEAEAEEAELAGVAG